MGSRLPYRRRCHGGLSEGETAVIRGDFDWRQNVETLGFETRGHSRQKNSILERTSTEGHPGEPGLFRDRGRGPRERVRETAVEPGGDRRQRATPLNPHDDVPDDVIDRSRRLQRE